MATANVTPAATVAKLDRATLALIHAAYVERMGAAMLKAQRSADMIGAPASLWDAGLFLAAHGFDAADCAAV